MFYLCVAPFKGKSETGPPKKKKSFKDVKKPHPKSPKKPSPSAAAQKGPPAAKQPKTQINGSTKPAPKGTASESITLLLFVISKFLVTFFFSLKGGKVPSNFSTVDVLRKRLHEKIEESRGQVCRF